MKAKERTAIPRVEMNELDAEYRSHSRKEEVNRGLTEEQALTEAKRCLDCANPGCMEGCPVGIDIPPFHQEYRTRRVSGSSQDIERNQRIARCLRSCVSAGKAMRIQMYPFKDERKAGCHRLSGTLRRRLRAGKRTNLRTGNQRKEWH